jgi:hypothetical protein
MVELPVMSHTQPLDLEGLPIIAMVTLDILTAAAYLTRLWCQSSHEDRILNRRIGLGPHLIIGPRVGH